MSTLIKTFVWILHNFLTLLVIVVVLYLGQVVMSKWNEIQQVKDDLLIFSSVHENGVSVINDLKKDYTKETKEFGISFADLPEEERSEVSRKLADRIENFEQKKEDILEGQRQNISFKDLLMGRPVYVLLINALKRDVEIELLTQSIDHLNLLKSILDPMVSDDEIHEKIEGLNHDQKVLTSKRKKIEEEMQQISWWKRKVPGTWSYERYRQLQSELRDVMERFQENINLIEKLNGDLHPNIAQLREFEVDIAPIDEILEPLGTKIRSLDNLINGNWLAKLWEVLKEPFKLLPAALMILLGIILAPIGIRALFYYILAPLAARLPPIRLLPETSGDLALVTDAHAVAISIVVDAENELLVHSEFLNRAPDTVFKDTSWFLNKKRPFTSLASGMFALTRIRTDAPGTVGIAATKASFKIGTLSIPKGAALVMQPHNLVGIVQHKTSPVHITSHWRLTSLHAWLTLQLRYLAFHGPVQLIVQGGQGIRIGQADGGQAINQAAIIGFSPNLDYSTRRSEPFFAYLSGKRELLNDRFSGDKGFYVYQVMPSLDKRKGFPIRGLEGLTDSLLKVFGI